jgi:hypothetical protein
MADRKGLRMRAPFAAIARHSLDDLPSGRHLLLEIRANGLDDGHVASVARGAKEDGSTAGSAAREKLTGVDALSNAPGAVTNELALAAKCTQVRSVGSCAKLPSEWPYSHSH